MKDNFRNTTFVNMRSSTSEEYVYEWSSGAKGKHEIQEEEEKGKHERQEEKENQKEVARREKAYQPRKLMASEWKTCITDEALSVG